MALEPGKGCCHRLGLESLLVFFSENSHKKVTCPRSGHTLYSLNYIAIDLKSPNALTSSPSRPFRTMIPMFSASCGGTNPMIFAANTRDVRTSLEQQQPPPPLSSALGIEDINIRQGITRDELITILDEVIDIVDDTLSLMPKDFTKIVDKSSSQQLSQ